MLNQTATLSEAFVGCDKKVLHFTYIIFKALQPTFWNTDNGGRDYDVLS